MAATQTGDPRLTEVVEDLLASLRGFIRKHHISHDEYRRAVGFMLETAEKGEIPLLFDVFLEATVDQVDAAGRGGTETSVEGPFYALNAPIMKSPCVLPHRTNEPSAVGHRSLRGRRIIGKRDARYVAIRRPGSLLAFQYSRGAGSVESARSRDCR